MPYVSLRRALAVLWLASPLCAFAEAADSPKPFYREFWDETIGSTADILKNGDWAAYIPAKIYHMPFAYNQEQLDEQNNDPLPGFGIGRGRYLENGNWAGVYAIGFQDSWDRPEWQLGYNYNWLWRTEGGIRYGLGATVGLAMRSDYGNYVPFPIILPVFHLGMGRVSLEATYIPGVKRGTGNVAFFWLKVQ